jgi:hypothetical protein
LSISSAHSTYGGGATHEDTARKLRAALSVLAYNLRVMNIVGTRALLAAIRALAPPTALQWQAAGRLLTLK